MWGACYSCKQICRTFIFAEKKYSTPVALLSQKEYAPAKCSFVEIRIRGWNPRWGGGAEPRGFHYYKKRVLFPQN